MLEEQLDLDYLDAIFDKNDARIDDSMPLEAKKVMDSFRLVLKIQKVDSVGKE